MVVWLTGLSGAGKSTVAKQLAGKLRSAGRQVLIIDGDEIRMAIGDENTGYDRKSRLVNAMRICRFAKLFEPQADVVIVATMSLFSEIHDWNRKNFAKYLEVLMQVEMEILKSRDIKGVYNPEQSSEQVAGLDQEYDLPSKPDLIIENNKDLSNLQMQIDNLHKLIQGETG